MTTTKKAILAASLLVGLPLFAVALTDKAPRAHVWLAHNLIGNDIVSESGEALGKVADVVIRPGSETSYVIATLGSWSKSEKKLFAMPWSVLRTDEAEKTSDISKRSLVLLRTKESLSSAPGFDATSWPDMTDPAWTVDIDAFYSSTVVTRPRRTVDAAAASKIITWKVSDLKGASVVTAESVALGEIKDLAIDTNGRFNYAAISVGGFLGLGEKHVAVPFDMLKFTLTKDEVPKRVIALDVTKKQLGQAPEFSTSSKDREHMVKTVWIDSVYAHFACAPYWEVEAATPSSAPKK